ncbi:hypothetical protein [Yersinia sp. 1652 StPb PI]|uniref:hypothetical protein n=1 Tax=unclassified Yersinia (in: enterobacteria) TaxID=2653513 RepID=UPI00355B2819
MNDHEVWYDIHNGNVHGRGYPHNRQGSSFDMKKAKHEKSLWVILVIASLIYLLIPPYLIAYFFKLYNLNPFHIVPLPHFNPFKSERGIPLSQTFSYLLFIWLIFNAFISTIVAIIYRIFFYSDDNE